MKQNKKDALLVGFIFAALFASALALLFFSYMIGYGDNSFMDFTGWLYFFLSSCLHASIIALIPFAIIYVPLTLIGVGRKPCSWILGILYMLILIIFFVNRFVFHLYHFHINGFVLSMLFGEGADEVFSFSFQLYIKAFLFLLAAGLVVFLLYQVALYLSKRIESPRRFYIPTLVTFLIVTILSQGIHIYGAATLRSSILESDAGLPYYFPLSMNSTLDRWGLIDSKEITTINISEKSSKINYPANPLTVSDTGKCPNIVIIAIDGWNFRTLTEECMPNVWNFKQQSEYYESHLSGSNGTRGGIFGLFTGLSSYYWKSFEYSSIRPVLIDQLVAQGYDIQLYPSATLQSPPFDRVLFKQLDSLNISTNGKTAYQRDNRLTHNFLADLSKHKESKRPFFSFLFYDMAHAIAIPKSKNKHFQPAWNFADYSRLSNNIDPTPYFNLYRNCLYQVDSLIGNVLNALRENGLMDNTIIIVTADHGQEFNENKKNYWGHNGNYSKYQIQVPLMVYYPGGENRTISYRTTHYDIVPTLMEMAFKVENRSSDYSMGYSLHDSTSRGWHIVGNEIDYAFITEDGHIIEKKGNGRVKVYDENLNIDKEYKPSSSQINDNFQLLNRFYK